MTDDKNNLTCSEFEELLSDYLEDGLGKAQHAVCSVHVLSCTSCHELLNEVKAAVGACHTIAAPGSKMSQLEARILERTTPQVLMSCEEFEEHLTDYLDGFIAAAVFHRWERHASVCGECSDLPGAVVRSIAACNTMKLEDLDAPVGLTHRILGATLGSAPARKTRPWSETLVGWIRGLSLPVQVSQFASAAAILLFALLFLVNEASADGSVRGVYEKGFELATQTYRQGADMMLGESNQAPPTGEPVEGDAVREAK